jgi:hypothetical protein
MWMILPTFANADSAHPKPTIQQKPTIIMVHGA